MWAYFVSTALRRKTSWRDTNMIVKITKTCQAERLYEYDARSLRGEYWRKKKEAVTLEKGQEIEAYRVRPQAGRTCRLDVKDGHTLAFFVPWASIQITDKPKVYSGNSPIIHHP
jgi:hypothetical protein